MSVIGYKGFEKDLKCRGFQYEIGKTYKHNGNIELCGAGFHFCRKFMNVDNYYSFKSTDYRFCQIEALGDILDDEDKSTTSEIKIIKEITREEMYSILNNGSNNTGYSNTGDRNTGVFCNKEPKLILFNKETDMSWVEWRNTRAFDALKSIYKSIWVHFEDMTDLEKKQNKSAETCGGYLKEIPRKKATAKWWNNISTSDKLNIFQLPNFDLDVFNDIMELKISKKEYKEVLNG